MLKLLNEFFTLYFVFPAILLLGFYLTWRLRFVQFSKLFLSFKHLFKKNEADAEGDITHYQAIASVLAGNFGTGNISGMAIALSTGGPGALVWMWIMAFLGAAIQYSSCILGAKYRKKNPAGEYVGGPMYYLQNGLKKKSLATVFSLCVIFGAFAVGNFAQTNSMALPLVNFGIHPLIVGLTIGLCVALVILGGLQRVAVVSSAVVPMMALLYIGTAFIILAMNASEILPALKLVFLSAFGAKELIGGALGLGVMKALTTGFDRAIFATDAGTGTVPILQAGSRTKDPVIVGVVALVSPFMVMIVCTATALVLIITGAYSVEGLKSTSMVAFAFESGVGKPLGSVVVIVSLVLFGYTTALAWASCLDRAVGFLFGHRLIRPFQLLYILCVPVGALMHVDFVWILADISLSLMVVINLFGIACLSKEVIYDSHNYFYLQREKVNEVV